ncbi:MAG: cytochrome c, partial [Verrucomicrobia bacterium]|nr:cytochrome c [Verrucomicrobiota bacterium]
GRRIVAASSCLNCHTLLDHGIPLENTFTAPAFERLRPGHGCLAESPAGRAPHFGLSAEDRLSLAAFLQSPDRSEAPAQDFKRLVNEYLCARCHALEGPPTECAATAPPPLTDAGNKLRASWLEQVLNQRKRARPWMSLRMPHYGASNVGPLVNLFAAVAGAAPGEGETMPEPTAEQVRAGARLLGTGEGGLRCITCHDFRGEGSGGDKRGPELTGLFARLRTDWLRRWLRDPARLQTDTAMPACLIQTPAAQREAMVSALLQALWAGKNLPVPEGLREEARAHYLLVADAPVVARTFMPGVSGRAFAVGLPGQVNYCFDAQTCRLAYAWTGDFLDMKPVWTGRSGTALPLGPKFYSTFWPVSLRIGDPGAEPRVRFRGCELVGGAPEFLYDVDDLAVRESIARADKGFGLTRTFDLGERDRDAWLLAGAADGVTITCSAGPFENGRLRIPAGKPVQIELRIMAK